MTTLISCIFCQCQLPAAASMTKYEEHLQGWHNITVTEELKRAVQIANGLQEIVNTAERTASPFHHPCSSDISLTTLHTPKPCIEQLSRSPAFSLNSSQSRADNLPEVKLESADQNDARKGCILVSDPVIKSPDSVQETKNGRFQLGQVKTESKDDEQVAPQIIGVPDECALEEERHSHLPLPQNRATVKCEECGKYLSKHSLLKHKKAVHRGEKPDKVNCDECGKYLSKTTLLTHKRIMHRGEKPFCCKINDCNERFHLESKLGDHKRKEHDHPKLKCKAEGCKLEFLVFNEFRRHQNTHQTMIECEECGKRLIQKNLQEHMKFVHQKAKPEVKPVIDCEMENCGKKFSLKSHLADHMRMVHGFAKLKCNVGECTAEFMSDAVLMKHKKSHFK